MPKATAPRRPRPRPHRYEALRRTLQRVHDGAAAAGRALQDVPAQPALETLFAPCVTQDQHQYADSGQWVVTAPEHLRAALSGGPKPPGTRLPDPTPQGHDLRTGSAPLALSAEPSATPAPSHVGGQRAETLASTRWQCTRALRSRRASPFVAVQLRVLVRRGGGGGEAHMGDGPDSAWRNRAPGPHRNTARQAMDGLWTEVCGQQMQSNDPGDNQHILNTPIIGRR